jgi:hypothetical protein
MYCITGPHTKPKPADPVGERGLSLMKILHGFKQLCEEGSPENVSPPISPRLSIHHSER